ncbi:MAG: glycerophosphodiester phosphodiesterase [Candidatus Binatia bacterium]
MDHSNPQPCDFFSGPRPRIIGHRGAAGEAPENTLPSFQRALADGAALVELDVRASADGEIVIIHDESVDRTTDGHGAVNDLSLAELKRFDAGYRFTKDAGATYPYRGQRLEIPTLAELFAFLPEAKAIVEIKQSSPSMVKRVIETVLQAGKERDVLLATEEDRIMTEIRAELGAGDPPMATGFCYGEVAAFVGWLEKGAAAAFRPPGQAMQLPREFQGRTLVSAETVQAAHALDAEMFVWTINDLDEMARVLSLGVDGIITDYPGRLRALLAAT